MKKLKKTGKRDSLRTGDKQVLLAALQKELAENPERLIEIVDKVLTHAKNSLGFFCEVRDMLDGKPGLNVEDPEAGSLLNFELNVHFRDSIEGRPVASEADDEN